ncbi:NTP transferase domain-containing protein [Nitrospinota bacterium]
MVKAVILAAGQGSRLRPLTDDRPKCMVPLVGVSLLKRQLAVLKEIGILDVTVVGGYRPEFIGAHDVRLLINQEFERTNMVASMFCARDLFDGEDDILVIYGDIVYERRVADKVLACDAPICLPVDREWHHLWSLRFENPLSDAETLRLSPDGKIIELGKKPGSLQEIEAQYIGMFLIRANHAKEFANTYDRLDRAASYDGKDFQDMYMTTFLQLLVDKGWTLQAVSIDGGWLEIDSVDDLSLYERLYREGTLDTICCLA